MAQFVQAEQFTAVGCRYTGKYGSRVLHISEEINKIQESRENWNQVNKFSFLKIKVCGYVISRRAVLKEFADGII